MQLGENDAFGEGEVWPYLIIIFSKAPKASGGFAKVVSDQLTAQGPIEWQSLRPAPPKSVWQLFL